jgi:hypothetical protein
MPGPFHFSLDLTELSELDSVSSASLTPSAPNSLGSPLSSPLPEPSLSSSSPSSSSSLQFANVAEKWEREGWSEEGARDYVSGMGGRSRSGGGRGGGGARDYVSGLTRRTPLGPTLLKRVRFVLAKFEVNSLISRTDLKSPGQHLSPYLSLSLALSLSLQRVLFAAGGDTLISIPYWEWPCTDGGQDGAPGGGETGNAGDGHSRDDTVTVEETRKKYLRSRLGL